MKLLGNKFLMVCIASLFLTGTAMAFPIQGTTVRMQNGNLPYEMLDLSDNELYYSFCLESQHHFEPGQEYIVKDVGNRAKGGGSWKKDNNQNMNGDKIDKASKKLYAAYFSGAFDGYTDAAILVQEAIWWSESEKGGSQSAYDDLMAYIGGDYDISGWKFAAVNLASKEYYRNGSWKWIDNQSQLVGKKVPEASSMLLLGTGLVALAGLGRRRLIK